MLDFFHVPQFPKGVDQQIFNANSPTTGVNWATWTKPRGINWVEFFVWGGGGAGGAGAVGASGSAAGGGGGGSAVQMHVVYPAWALPDLLYISVGEGGLGGSGAGGNGIPSWIGLYPSSTWPQWILANCAGGGGGGAASAGTGGAAGGGGGATGIAQQCMLGLCIPGYMGSTSNNLGGQAGIVGSSGSASALTLPTTGLLVTGGSGGGGYATGNGGGMNTPGYPFPGGTIASGGQSYQNNGSNGFQAIPKLLYFYGGMGGGAGTVNGGNGGNGSYGCGGGGGGGAFTGFAAGNGGNGGPGLVIATSW